jgi:hypothetical protein
MALLPSWWPGLFFCLLHEMLIIKVLRHNPSAIDTNVPYMASVKNVTAILSKMQNACVPDAFGYDFLRDLGFTSSNDRSVIKVLKYLGFLDASGKPLTPYREFTSHTKSKLVLADRLRTAFDDLYITDKKAHDKSAVELKGWFKSKTGIGDAVAAKIASIFKAFANFADFSSPPATPIVEQPRPEPEVEELEEPKPIFRPHPDKLNLGLVYRLEIHLPDTQNVETYRAIFKALREEMME